MYMHISSCYMRVEITQYMHSSQFTGIIKNFIFGSILKYVDQVTGEVFVATVLRVVRYTQEC